MDGFASLLPASTADAVLAGVRSCVAAEIAPIVREIDHGGAYPAAAMRSLGEAGLFALHCAGSTPLATPSLAAAIDAMAVVGETCMSTAFCTWCQDACAWYLEMSDNADLRASQQSGLATGAVMGGTGLSNPVKASAGIETFKLRGKRAGGGWVVSGVLPWVSNLGDGHQFGTVFEDADNPAHKVMALFTCGRDGVEIRQNAHFVALEGTGTYSLLFRRAFLPDAMVLSDDGPALMRRVRPGFTLLQTGMGLGVIGACVTLMREADVTHESTNRYLPLRPETLAEHLHDLRARIATLAATPTERDPGYLREVLETRLATSELTLAATSAAVLHGGSRGYLEGSDIARRQREGNFVALITPSVRHLRMELARMARH